MKLHMWIGVNAEKHIAQGQYIFLLSFFSFWPWCDYSVRKIILYRKIYINMTLHMWIDVSEENYKGQEQWIIIYSYGPSQKVSMGGINYLQW